MDKAFKGGAKIAHRWTKVPVMKQVDFTAAGSSLPHDLLDEQVQKWQTLWACSTAAPPTQWPQTPVVRISSESIRTAAALFPAATSAHEGMSPCHISLLSVDALDALAKIYLIWEVMGDVGPTMRDMITVLLPKPKGGYRPIGLFRALYRVWGRVRANDVRTWVKDAMCEDGIFTMMPGRRPGDAVWRAQVKALALKTEGWQQLEVNWDIAKCFEHVQRPLLAKLAMELGYPPHVLRLSLSAYSWPRLLKGDFSIVSNPIASQQGIVAGSPLAIFELAAYMYSAAYGVLHQHPRADLNIFVDDASLAVHQRATHAAISSMKMQGKLCARRFRTS